jgi:pimeloyl-ACP methyl ester carboxylesterase
MGAIVAALDKLGIEKFHLVGHSMGALIALRLAADNQDRVLSVTCFGMPVFATAKEARSRISKSKTSLRLAYYGRTSRIICAIWCRLLRPVSKHIAKLYLNRLPRSVAEDSVLHTWTSYKSSMENIIEQQHPIDDMKKLKISYSFIYGLTDSDALVKDQEKLHALIMPGGHNGILKRPNTAIKFIEKTINGLYNRSTV